MLTCATSTIDLTKLAQNVATLRSCCSTQTKLCAVVKADAYGHGTSLVLPTLRRCGIETLAVATLTEAIDLRELGWQDGVMVLMNDIDAAQPAERRDRMAAVLDYGIEVVLSDTAQAAQWEDAAANRNAVVQVHLKIDSGMGRGGILPAEFDRHLNRVLGFPSIALRGICTHFANAESQDDLLRRKQLETFHQVVGRSTHRVSSPVLRHASNTAATLQLPEAQFDMVRCGLGLYGYAPADHLVSDCGLQPILRLVSRVAVTKDLPADHAVGYGPTRTTRRPTKIGIVPLGYADGLDRRMSSFGIVGTPYGDAPIFGQISMDQLTMDLTDLPGVHAGTEVVLIDDDPYRPNSVASLARQLGTIPYEITCRLSKRIRRLGIGADALREGSSSAARVRQFPCSATPGKHVQEHE